MRLIRKWLPLAVVITLLAGLIHVTGQQILRQGANDPQIQISEDLADQLASGLDTSQLPPADTTDLAKSLAPYIIVFDESGKVLFSTARLNGQVPTPPPGVLEYAKIHKQNRVTWEPQSGIREATVTTYYQGKTSGYVLVGRSLREVEERVSRNITQIALGWAFTMGASFIATAFVLMLQPKSRRK